MFRIKIIAVGKIKDRPLSDAAGEYVKRLRRYCQVEVAEVEDEAIAPGESGASVERHTLSEAKKIERRLPGGGAYIVSLDVGGSVLDTMAFADKLRMFSGRYREAVFVIGGSHGLHKTILERSDYRLSLSKMTFTHRIARLIILEQIYRAYKIINNEVYHK